MPVHGCLMLMMVVVVLFGILLLIVIPFLICMFGVKIMGIILSVIGLIVFGGDFMFTGLIIAGALTAAATVAGGVIAANKQKEINAENQARQEKENATTREREDNAVQRRVADLRLAGLSPTLAAGSAASSQALTAYQQNNNPTADIANAVVQGGQTMMDTFAQASGIQAQQQSISQSQMQTELLKQQAKHQEIQNSIDSMYGMDKASQELSNLEKSGVLTSAQVDVIKRNLALSDKNGLPVGVAPYNSSGFNFGWHGFGYNSSGNQSGNNFSLLNTIAKFARPDLLFR